MYIEWENIVNTSSIDLVNEMASVVNPTANWAKDTSSLFYALYKAVVDNNITDDDQTQRLKYAFHLMNKGFSEVLESRTAGSLKIPTGLRIENSGLNSGAKAKINSMLHVTHVVNRPFIVGCVYEDHQPDLLKDLANNIFKEDQIPSEKDMKLCSVIITPACDIAQNKMFKTKGKDAGQDSCLHRVLFGLMFKSVSPPLKDKAKEARSEIALIWYNNEEWWIVFHFGTLTSMIESQIKGSLMFAIKSDMLFDLQSKAANHVNRLGKYLLK